MRLNADFQARVVVRPADYRWVDSPTPGVERMMLDRIGDEVARATSLVRYAPMSRFPAHVHGGGEEFLVLEGEFGDEHRSYPAGTYVRNPVGTSHAPRVGKDGCIIFVKLHQFEAGDDAQLVIDTTAGDFSPGPASGLEVMPLHRYRSEQVALVRWASNTRLDAQVHNGGEELLVLEGTYRDEHGEYPAGSWLRNPAGSRNTPYTLGDGALIWVKTGHLPP